MPLPWKSRAQLLESSRREQERLNMQRRAEAAAKLRAKEEEEKLFLQECRDAREDVRGS